MKISKLLLAGAVAAFATSAFAADVNLHFTGSTAFRNGAVNGIKDWFTANATGVKIIYTSGSTFTGATQQAFTGTIGGKTYFVSCVWSGSVEGVDSVAKKTPATVANFFTEAAVAAGSPAGVAVATAGNIESAFADAGFADCSQIETGLTSSATYNIVTSEPVGVIPFVWVRANNADSTEQASVSTLKNISALQVQSALSGFAPLSGFTGNAADSALTVHVIGRNNQSGTRVNTFLETGFGRDSECTQFQAVTSAPTGGQITALNQDLVFTGGYSSGGTLARVLGNDVAPGLGAVVIGYMGISDAGNGTNIPGVTLNLTTGVFEGANISKVLAFNGVPFSIEAVKNGSYTFWNYENLLRRPGLTGDAAAALNGIRDKIKTADAGTAGVKMSDMAVGRDGAGKKVL